MHFIRKSECNIVFAKHQFECYIVLPKHHIDTMLIQNYLFLRNNDCFCWADEVNFFSKRSVSKLFGFLWQDKTIMWVSLAR